jgi:hypothetical protein
MVLPMNLFKIQSDPRHQVILEGALDGLVKYVGGNDLMYVCLREF